MEYYIISNGQQVGPMPKESLTAYGLNRDSYVWRAGLNEWVKAGMLPELSDLLVEESAFGAYAQYVPPTQPQQQPPFGQQQPPLGQQQPQYVLPHTNWMPWAIVATVIGFLFSCIGVIFGIMAINAASKANNAYAMGDEFAGDSSNSTAKTMTIVALVLGGVGMLVTIGLFSVG